MKQRIYGFDLIRAISFFAIYIFHVSLMMFYSTEIAVSSFSKVAFYLESYARTFSVSGFTVIFLTCLLMGFSDSNIRGKLKLFSFMFFAWLIFQKILSPAYDAQFGWDVYPLILLSIGLCLLLRTISNKLIYILSAIGFIMLWIPFWEYRNHVLPLSESWQNILGFTDCSLKEADEWPIFPWAGICWLSYGIGLKVGAVWKRNPGKLRISTLEATVWGGLLCLSTRFYGPMYHVSLGSEFSCMMYRFLPQVFWSHFIWPLFFIRLSLDVRIQHYLGSLTFPKFVSSLTMSKNFWISYFTNYIFCFFYAVSYHYLLKLDANNIYLLIPAIGLLGFPFSECVAYFLSKARVKFITRKALYLAKNDL